ncbi:MAG: hypothetical protein JNL87_15460 [Burkholderiaceae bacterium]|nr:hypothetical protein [Burkholderiaceae bacterium]
MIKAVLPLALAFVASTAMACPAADKSMDAKAGSTPTVASALSTVTQQSRAEADKRPIKTVEAKKPAS